MRSLPAIHFIEEEGFAKGSQLDVEWYLDRLDQVGPELDQAYHPIGDGAIVDVYILDSGMKYDHEEFEYRAKYPGRDPTDEYNIINNNNRELMYGNDCHGHGTHVGSLCGGKTYGSAKNVRLFSVRVLGCSNNGPWSVVIAGLDIVADRAVKTGRPSIISMSLSGLYHQAVDEAVTKVIQEGVVVVVAAGNGKTDSCRSSPASNSLAITVAGTRRGDGLYLLGSGSNFGACVDIFAPGERVNAADRRCVNCSIVFSGTSMATPLVSGLAAIALGREPLLSPSILKRRLIEESTKDIIDFSGMPRAFVTTTPNRLVTIPGKERNLPLSLPPSLEEISK